MQLSALLTRPAQPASSSGFRLMAVPDASLLPRNSCPAHVYLQVSFWCLETPLTSQCSVMLCSCQVDITIHHWYDYAAPCMHWLVLLLQGSSAVFTKQADEQAVLESPWLEDGAACHACGRQAKAGQQHQQRCCSASCWAPRRHVKQGLPTHHGASIVMRSGIMVGCACSSRQITALESSGIVRGHAA